MQTVLVVVQRQQHDVTMRTVPGVGGGAPDDLQTSIRTAHGLENPIRRKLWHASPHERLFTAAGKPTDQLRVSAAACSCASAHTQAECSCRRCTVNPLPANARQRTDQEAADP
jgi:hypothetical protein